MPIVWNNPLKYTDPSGWLNDLPNNSYDNEGGNIGDSWGSSGGGGWDPTMGFHSTFIQISNNYGTFSAMNAYNSGVISNIHYALLMAKGGGQSNGITKVDSWTDWWQVRSEKDKITYEQLNSTNFNTRYEIDYNYFNNATAGGDWISKFLKYTTTFKPSSPMKQMTYTNEKTIYSDWTKNENETDITQILAAWGLGEALQFTNSSVGNTTLGYYIGKNTDLGNYIVQSRIATTIADIGYWYGDITYNPISGNIISQNNTGFDKIGIVNLQQIFEYRITNTNTNTTFNYYRFVNLLNKFPFQLKKLKIK